VRVNAWKIFGYTVLAWLGLSLLAGLVTAATQREHPAYDRLDALSMVWSLGSLVMSIITAVRTRRAVEVLWGIVACIVCALPLFGVFAGIAFFAWCFTKIERHKLSFAGTSVGATLDKPQIPQIGDVAGVVTWFLQQDDKIADFRSRFPTALTAFRDEVVREINAIQSGEHLQQYLSQLSACYSSALAHAASEFAAGRNPADGGYAESATAAKMRILGYILLRKYGIQPQA
jgi:hypothetical protein